MPSADYPVEQARQVTAGGTPKRLVGHAEKALLPEETWTLLEPALGEVGVTRLADITGLDRIGHPVVLSVRPASRTLSVDAGKGATLLLANISAGMEAVERHSAEIFSPSSFVERMENMPDEQLAYSLAQLPISRRGLFSPRKFERWTWVHDLSTAREYALPSALLSLAPVRTPGESMFQLTSNGIAAGNTWAEAIVSALYELIERDGISLWSLANESGCHPPRIAEGSIPFPHVRKLLQRLDEAAIGVVLFDCTAGIRPVAVILAVLYDRMHRHVGVFKGYGAHLSSEVAILRAITEAIQSRLVLIAASRDDMLRYTFRTMRQADASSTLGRILAIPETLNAEDMACSSRETFEEDLRVLQTALQNVGLCKILAVDMSIDTIAPLVVVRALVPGLEGYRYDNYAPGVRATHFLENLGIKP